MGERHLSAKGDRFAIATPHAAATEAGLRAFEAGGNAVDAAVAANAVLAVAYPHMCGIGGDLFAIVADAKSRTVLNGSGAAALAMEAAAIRKAHGSLPAQGPLSISVPGAVAAWSDLLSRFGRLSLAQAMEAAISHAEDGLPVARSLAGGIEKHRERLSADSGLRSVMLSADGRPRPLGDKLRQPALAATLRSIAGRGAEALYGGSVGAALVAGLRRMGSLLTTEDFRRHATEEVTPLARPYRALEILVPPPNSQGFVLEEILGCIERGELVPDHLGSDAPMLARIFLLASDDRDRFLADQRRARVPIDELLSEAHSAELLDWAREAVSGKMPGRSVMGDTVGIVAGEIDGLWVSINQSLFDGFGSGVLEPETGIVCHNRGSAFSLDQGSPNRLEGGKRPAHTLMPVMALDRGVPSIASATMGRNAHAQIHAELLTAVVDQKRDAFQAVDRPRWLVGGLRAEASGVVAESRVPAAVLSGFRSAGIEVDELEEWDEQVGHAQLIVRGADRKLHSASDPRADGAAAAV